MEENCWDVIIIGAGPAGLSAALTLGRCRRKVLLCDRGTPRNWASKSINGFLTRDGTNLQKFLDLAREDLSAYPNIIYRLCEASAARCSKNGFEVDFTTFFTARSRKLLLATGLFDDLPNIEGIEKFYGKSVFQCPYCDGWEVKDQTLIAYGKGIRGLEMARALTAWSKNIILCTDGPSGYSEQELNAISRNKIRLYEIPIKRVHGKLLSLEELEFENNERVPADALFFDTYGFQQSSLAKQLGCIFKENGGIKCGRYSETNIPGLYAAGNVIKDVHLSIVAAGEGTKAAIGINKTLTREDYYRS